MKTFPAPAACREQRHLLVKLARILFRPAVQLLLRHGISGVEIQEIVRWCCVDVALNEREFAIPGRRAYAQTYSHAAIRTGFTRVEVRRLAEQAEPEIDSVTERTSRIERVIEVWRTDERFLDDNGEPRALPLRGPAPSLQAIVRQEGRDTPVRAMADTLVAAGNAEWEGRNLALVNGVFSATNHSLEDVAVLTQIASDFMFSFQQAFSSEVSPQPRFREAFFRDISVDQLDAVREEVYSAISSFNADCLEILKRYRAEHGAERIRVGVGTYSFVGAPSCMCI